MAGLFSFSVSSRILNQNPHTPLTDTRYNGSKIKKRRKKCMAYWMKELGRHHSSMRHAHPDDPLIVVFDIDDTILDLRHAVVHVLASFDRHHGTRFFLGFTVEEVRGDDSDLPRLVEQTSVPKSQKNWIADWCRGYFWSPLAIVEGHVAFHGVMEVVAWLQSQPNTFVGLNTGRPESMRDATLHCLNRLGGIHGASFTSELLFMRRADCEISDIAVSKAEGIAYFQQQGYRVAAFLDNEPENLQAVAALDHSNEILLMHADTQFKSSPQNLPARAISGVSYHRDLLIEPSRASRPA
jgi:hypothetical protein